MNNGIVIIGSGCRPPAGEKHPQAGRQRAADGDRRRQHGRVQQA